MTTRHPSLVLLAALACALLACDDDPATPEPQWPPLPQTPPENVLKNLVTIYNDTEHTAAERLAAYEELLLHPSVDPPRAGAAVEPTTWGSIKALYN